MNLQHRPRLALPILLTLLSIQLYTLPEWGAKVLHEIFHSPSMPEGIPNWVRMTIGLIGLLVLGCYVIWIERTDQRRYDDTVSRFKEFEKIHGFDPLPDLVIERVDPALAGIVRRARELRRIRLSGNDLDGDSIKSIGALLIGNDGLEKGLVIAVRGGGYIIHPSLVLDQK